MISFTVRMKFRSDDRARVAEFLTELAKASRLEPGCVITFRTLSTANPTRS